MSHDVSNRHAVEVTPGGSVAIELSLFVLLRSAIGGKYS